MEKLIGLLDDFTVIGFTLVNFEDTLLVVEPNDFVVLNVGVLDDFKRVVCLLDEIA